MKTRIIHTDFWLKMVKIKAPKDVKLLYHYLFTNSYINMCGIYEMPDIYLLLETGLTKIQFQRSKECLEKMGKVYFYDDWVFIVGAEEHSNYKNGEKNYKAYLKELEEIPANIKDYFKEKKELPILLFENKIVLSTTQNTTPKSETINKKPEIINKKEDGYKSFLKSKEKLTNKLTYGKQN